MTPFHRFNEKSKAETCEAAVRTDHAHLLQDPDLSIIHRLHHVVSIGATLRHLLAISDVSCYLRLVVQSYSVFGISLSRLLTFIWRRKLCCDKWRRSALYVSERRLFLYVPSIFVTGEMCFLRGKNRLLNTNSDRLRNKWLRQCSWSPHFKESAFHVLMPSRVNCTPVGNDASVRFNQMQKQANQSKKRIIVIKVRVKQVEKRATGFLEGTFLKNSNYS